ncbi:hypothetical protein CDL15_Pgr004069 [Punica granatum]|uniref:Uncharacterized protein n=1 Tax=Punica granatum TaxID=22663 RepID=A0A218XFW3_PUNGR|nr:hypothetical protein CDL15_Pgr004069 [Punica granatum]
MHGGVLRNTKNVLQRARRIGILKKVEHHRLAEEIQRSGSSMSADSIAQTFAKAAQGKNKKGHIYGMNWALSSMPSSSYGVGPSRVIRQ